jgi:hypothetical protein
MFKEILAKFHEAVKLADAYNTASRQKRFYPMAQYKDGTDICTEVGVYDGLTKRWVLLDVRAHNAMELADEMLKMVKKNSAK